MDDLMGKIQEVLSDEDSMKQLSELAESLFSSAENKESENNVTENAENVQEKSDTEKEMDFDLSSLFKISQLMSSVSDDKNAELLIALKPLLKEERRAKVDKAVKLLKLFAVWNVLKDSGMLEDLF